MNIKRFTRFFLAIIIISVCFNFNFYAAADTEKYKTSLEDTVLSGSSVTETIDTSDHDSGYIVKLKEDTDNPYVFP